MQAMSESEILKQIDLLLDITEQDLNILPEDKLLILNCFYLKVKKVMENYEKVLEVNHFKQTQI